MKEVSDTLEPGGGALFILARSATSDKVVDGLSEFDGHVARTSLSEEDEEALRKAIEHDDVKAGAEDNLDLS